MTKLITIPFLILISNFAYGKDIDRCFAVEANNFFNVIFPIKNKRQEWEWYRAEQTQERTEYAWIAEPGFFAKGRQKKFQGNGVAFAISIGSSNLKIVNRKSGGLADLVKETSKYAYLTKKPETEIERDQHFQFMVQSKVAAKALNDGGEISVAILDQNTVNAAKLGSPTHMKMQTIVPYPGESYECIVKINKINKSARFINY